MNKRGIELAISRTRANFGPDRVDDSLSVLLDLRLILALDHNSGEILRSRVSNEDSPLSLQLLFDGVDHESDAGHRLQRGFVSNSQVDQDLGISLKLPGKLA